MCVENMVAFRITRTHHTHVYTEARNRILKLSFVPTKAELITLCYLFVVCRIDDNILSSAERNQHQASEFAYR